MMHVPSQSKLYREKQRSFQFASPYLHFMVFSHTNRANQCWSSGETRALHHFARNTPLASSLTDFDFSNSSLKVSSHTSTVVGMILTALNGDSSTFFSASPGPGVDVPSGSGSRTAYLDPLLSRI